MTHLAEDRQRMILDTATSEGGVVISQLASELAVSEMTIRRDLGVLAERGLVRRVHGGAVPVASARYRDRLSERAPAKAKAADKLACFLPKEGAIYLDGSTTMLHLVAHLESAHGLQVVTNNVETFSRLAAIDGLDPLLLGGRLDRRTDNLVGSLALRSILAIAFDAAFFSSWGLDPQVGPSEVTLEDAEVKDVVASRARIAYLAIDADKLGETASGVWQPERTRTVLATSLKPGNRRLAPYRKMFKTIL